MLLPRWQVFNFDQSPRYLLPVLPVVALAASRAADRWHDADARDAGVLVALAVAAAQNPARVSAIWSRCWNWAP